MASDYGKSSKAALKVMKVASTGKGVLAEYEGEEVWFNVGKGYEGPPFSSLSEGQEVHVKFQPKKEGGGGFVVNLEREGDGTKAIQQMAGQGAIKTWGKSPEERQSIEKQVCLKEASSICAILLEPPGRPSLDQYTCQVVATAKRLYQGIFGKGEDEDDEDRFADE